MDFTEGLRTYGRPVIVPVAQGTGAPQSPAAGSTAAAEQLGTVAPSAASSSVAITGTADVHASKTETTSTISGPDGTSTIAVATPTQTTTAVKPKKP